MSFLIAFGLALVAVPLARRGGAALGVVDRPDDPSLKIHQRPIPLLGGAAAVACALTALVLRHGYLRWPVLAGVAFAFAVGLLDDVRPLPAWPRLLLQAVAGSLLVAGGLRLTPLGALGGVGVVLLVVAITNAVNITDGQDGLAGGLAAIAALGFAYLAVLAGPSIVVGLGLALAGGLAGFLVWNVVRARIYLGNSGAYAVGALLAVLAARIADWYGWRGLIACGLCLGVFGFEVVATVVRRAASRRSLASGDRQHSYDLVALAVGRGPSTVVFWATGVIGAGLAHLALRLSGRGAAAIGAATIVAATAAGVLLWRGRGADGTSNGVVRLRTQTHHQP